MKYILIIALMLMLSVNAFAQQGYGGISWSIATPADELKNYIDETSYRGFGIDFRSFVTKSISVGGYTGWNILDQRVDGTIEFSNGPLNGAINGTQIRYVNSFPIMLTSHLHIGGPRSAIRPYIGIGVGTYYVVQRLEMGVNMIEKNNWHFGLAPEVGVLFPTDYVSILASLKYNQAFKSGEAITRNNFAFSYWSFNVGFLFPTY